MNKKQQISLKELLVIMYASWRTIVAFFAAGIATSTIFLLLTPNQYKTSLFFKSEIITNNENKNQEKEMINFHNMKIELSFKLNEINDEGCKFDVLSPIKGKTTVAKISNTENYYRIDTISESIEKSKECIIKIYKEIKNIENAIIDEKISSLEEEKKEYNKLPIKQINNIGIADLVNTINIVGSFNDIRLLDKKINRLKKIKLNQENLKEFHSEIVFPKKMFTILICATLSIFIAIYVILNQKFRRK